MEEEKQEIPAVERAENAPKPPEAAEPTLAGKLDLADRRVSGRAQRSVDAGNALDAIQRNMSAKEAWPDKIKSAWQNGADASKRKLVILEKTAHEKIAGLKAESSPVAKAPDVAVANPAEWTNEQKKQANEYLDTIDATETAHSSYMKAVRELKNVDKSSDDWTAKAAEANALERAWNDAKANSDAQEKALGPAADVLTGMDVGRKAGRAAVRERLVARAETAEAAPAQKPPVAEKAAMTEVATAKTEARMTDAELNARVAEAINQMISLNRADAASLRDYVNLKPSDYRPKESDKKRREIAELLFRMVPTTELAADSPEAKQLAEESTWGSEGVSMTIRDLQQRIPSIVGGLASEKLTEEGKRDLLSKLSVLKGELKYFSKQIGEEVDAFEADSAAYLAENIDALTPGTTPKPEPTREPLFSDIVEDRIANEKRKDLVRVGGETFDDMDAYVESSTRADEPAELFPANKIDLQRTISEGPRAVASARKEIQRGLTERVIRLSSAERDNLSPVDVWQIHEEISRLKGERKFLKDAIAAEKPVIRERKKGPAAPVEAPVPIPESNPDSLEKYLVDSETPSADSAKKIMSVNREKKAEEAPNSAAAEFEREMQEIGNGDIQAAEDTIDSLREISNAFSIRLDAAYNHGVEELRDRLWASTSKLEDWKTFREQDRNLLANKRDGIGKISTNEASDFFAGRAENAENAELEIRSLRAEIDTLLEEAEALADRDARNDPGGAVTRGIEDARRRLPSAETVTSAKRDAINATVRKISTDKSNQRAA